MLNFLPFKTKRYSSVCINHILFIHSAISGYLGFFHLLAIVNSATLNMHVQICLGEPAFNFFIYMSPVVKSLWHMVVLFLIFEKMSYCFLMWVYHFTFPPRVHRAPTCYLPLWFDLGAGW